KHTSGQIRERWFDGIGTEVRQSLNGDVAFSKSITLSDNSQCPATLMKCYSSIAIYWYRGSRLVSIEWILGGPNLLPGELGETPDAPNPTPAPPLEDIPPCSNTPLYVKHEALTDANGGKVLLE